jgi:hypothetical protein
MANPNADRAHGNANLANGTPEMADGIAEMVLAIAEMMLTIGKKGTHNGAAAERAQPSSGASNSKAGGCGSRV